MEKCPRCGRWTLELSSVEGALMCYNMKCRHEEQVNVEKYLKEHDDLLLLAQSLTLNGYHKSGQIRVPA